MHAKMQMIRTVQFSLALGLAAFAGSAFALEFQIAESPLKVDSLFTLGGSWRTQALDPSLIGKSTYYKYTHPGSNALDASGSGLCLRRVQDSAPATQTADSGPQPLPNYKTDPGQSTNSYGTGTILRGCSTSRATNNSNPSPQNLSYVNAPGSFTPNGDNGDLNFGKGDLVHAVAKLTTDITYSHWDYNVFVRSALLFDANYSKFTETHYDTSMQSSQTDLPHSVERLVGFDYDLLDYNISHIFNIADHDLNVKVGNQVLNWGESSLLALNSLNTINPPDARRLNLPGLDLKEAFRPIGMVTADTQVIEGVTVQGFYSYDWKPILVDPVGTFFSQSDTLGDGGDYAMLSFGKQPEDPGYVINDPRYPAGKRGFYRPIDTCGADRSVGTAGCVDALGAFGSTASRTVFRDHAEEQKRKPRGGDYGLALKTFLDSINNGTELAFYYANYDSRLPVVSAFAAQHGCLDNTGDAALGTVASDCGLKGPGMPNSGGTRGNEPIPVDTMRLIVEYPKDIHLMGLSFNTTVGDFALSGEYAYRSNLPIQIDTVDLTYTALQPAFPAKDLATVIPGRRSAFPAFITGYRGYACTSDADCIQPGQYIPGFERFKVGQANLTLLRLIGGDNPLGASQMTFLLETGMQRVFNMPAIGQLQLEATGSDTHISGGADGNPGIEPAGAAPIAVEGLRQNPTPNKDFLGYGTSESYGFRFVNLNRWDNALFGANLETLAIIRDDVKGSSPGIGTNFSQGRKQFNLGLRGDYLATYIGEIRYTWFTGGGHHDGQRDRDNIFVTLGYQF